MAKDISTKTDLRGIANLLGISEDDGELVHLIATAIGALRVAGYVWDTGTLAWVKMQQPASSSDISDISDVLKEKLPAETRIAYDSNNNEEYIGKNDTLNAATSATDWTIQKITYSSGNVTRIQVAEGAWDNKESYF